MNCKTIYYQSTNPNIQLGDFLYQNSERTIPAAAGYYADGNTSIWYETDAEGVVINSGSCLDTGVVIAALEPTSFEACLSASLCATASTYITYDMSNTSSIFYFNSKLYVGSIEYPYNGNTSSYFEGLRAERGTVGSVSTTSSLNYPQYTGSNSLLFTGSITGTNHGWSSFVDEVSPGNFSTKIEDYFENVTQSMCIEIWFKANRITSASRSNILYGYTNTIDNFTGYSIQSDVNQPGDIAFFMTAGPTGQRVLVATTESFADNRWHCASVKYNPSGSIIGNELVSASSLVTIVVDGKERELYKLSGSNQINISGSNGSIIPEGNIIPSLAISDVNHTPSSSITQWFNGRIGKLTFFDTGSNLPNNTYLKYQYYASRSIFNN